MELEDFAITAFEVPHDGTDNVGYCMNIDGKIFSFLTDLGHIKMCIRDRDEAGASSSLQAGSKAIPASVVLEITKRISGCSANFINSSF